MTTSQKKKLATKALYKALNLRVNAGIGLKNTFNVFELASKLGIEVRFVDIPSLEAMYLNKNPPEIYISSHRPAGRQVFSCGHEIGHHIFEHGSKIDEYLDGIEPNNEFNPEEYLAEIFASYLFMPKSLVNNSFQVRGWHPHTSSEEQYYNISNWIGVGYSTLIHQMRSGLMLISREKAKKLLKSTPKSIRTKILGFQRKGNLIITDFHWTSKAIDIEIGDLILLPSGVNFEGECIGLDTHLSSGSLFRGIVPGIGRFHHSESGWASYVRVSRRKYVGREIFRYLEDPEYEKNIIYS